MAAGATAARLSAATTAASAMRVLPGIRVLSKARHEEGSPGQWKAPVAAHPNREQRSPPRVSDVAHPRNAARSLAAIPVHHSAPPAGGDGGDFRSKARGASLVRGSLPETGPAGRGRRDPRGSASPAWTAARRYLIES